MSMFKIGYLPTKFVVTSRDAPLAWLGVCLNKRKGVGSTDLLDNRRKIELVYDLDGIDPIRRWPR
ncbi:MAG: hypothetical protein HQK60_18055 [Deltaproteobacteria bacterium]|nr:hypothetical protein [Deltaproteobacteria bacterium]